MSIRRLAGILAAVVAAAWATARGADVAEFVQSERPVALNRLKASVLANGAVIAAPSRCHPDYYYYWVRDAALGMDALFRSAGASPDSPVDRALVDPYLTSSRRIQEADNPSTASGRGLGEPKFLTALTAYDQPWGRPQDDGPALRAITLIRVARRARAVDDRLRELVVRDLDYVAAHRRDTSFDPWEEVRGHHFYTRMVQRRALIDGAAYVRDAGDTGRAEAYSAAASELGRDLRAHWDGSRGILKATLDQDGGLGYKAANLDTQVLLGVLHADGDADPLYGPASDEVLATAHALRAAFRELYPINRVTVDREGDPLGVALGRYPEDLYSGTDRPDPRGNPWVLCTVALAEVAYKAVAIWRTAGQIPVTTVNQPFVTALAPELRDAAVGSRIVPTDPRFAIALVALRDLGDSQLNRVRYHAYPDGSLSEQFDRDWGGMTSAADLTWNYAAILTALAVRPADLPGDEAKARARRARPPAAEPEPSTVPAGTGAPTPPLPPPDVLNRGGVSTRPRPTAAGERRPLSAVVPGPWPIPIPLPVDPRTPWTTMVTRRLADLEHAVEEQAARLLRLEWQRYRTDRPEPPAEPDRPTDPPR